MLSFQRREEIKRLLLQQKSVTVGEIARKLLLILRIDTIPKYREIACVLLEKFFRLLFYTLDVSCIQILFQGINIFFADVLHGTGQLDGFRNLVFGAILHHLVGIHPRQMRNCPRLQRYSEVRFRLSPYIL